MVAGNEGKCKAKSLVNIFTISKVYLNRIPETLGDGAKQNFEYAFIVIHGTPGEDGKLQGYLDMVGVSYNTSSSAIMALTFQKFHCNRYLSTFGIHMAEGVLIKKGDEINEEKIHR